MEEHPRQNVASDRQHLHSDLRDMLAETLETVFLNAGFTIVPAYPADLRAVRGLCEVHVYIDEDALRMAIPVIRLGAERPVTEVLSRYLEDRNESGQGPGKFGIDDGVIWYRATFKPAGGAAEAAIMALRMQATVEKIGPKLLNII